MTIEEGASVVAPTAGVTPEPVEVRRTDKDARVGWLCGACGVVWRCDDQPMVDDGRCIGPSERAAFLGASRCCSTRCETCGELRSMGRSYCPPCTKAHSEKLESEQFAKATQIDLANYDGEMLYRDGFWNEGYVEVNDWVHDFTYVPEGKRPTYAYACVAMPAPTFDVHEHVKEYLENAEYHEEAMEHADGVLLDLAEKLINKALEDVRSFYPDYTRAILLPKEP